MRSLKTKFIVAITGLIIVVVLGTAITLVNQKKLEIEQDIFLNARSFAELTANKISSLLLTSLKDNNSIYFSSEIKTILKNNTDIVSISVYDFNANLLYNTELDSLKFYQGPSRTQDNQSTISRIKSANLSVLTANDNVYYFQKNAPGQYQITDNSYKPIPYKNIVSELRNIKSIIQPVDNKYAVEYFITYDNLVKNLITSAYQIVAISLIAIVISIIVGYLLSSIVTKPLKQLTETVKKIAKGEFEIRSNIKSNDEVGILSESVDHMAEDLLQSTEARVFKEKLKKELEIAAKIQKDLLPKQLPNIQGINIAAQVVPATEIGGDVYDVLLDKNGLPYFYVGDVTGHGIPAGLLSSVTNAIITSTIDFADLIEIVINLNHVLRQKSAANIFITILLATYSNSEISFVSAGHEKAIYYNFNQKKSFYLDPGGIALGLFDDINDKLKLQKQILNSGDLFIMYTDGIPEAWRSDTERLGDQTLLQYVDEVALTSTTAEEFKHNLLLKIKQFMGTYEQKDDITLLVIQKTN